MFEFNAKDAKWFFEPKNYSIENDRVEIETEPNTDFWQRTYYGFRNDNAHVLYITTDERYFSFTVKAEFNSTALFDQCGVVIYQNSENWVKAGMRMRIASSKITFSSLSSQYIINNNAISGPMLKYSIFVNKRI